MRALAGLPCLPQRSGCAASFQQRVDTTSLGLGSLPEALARHLTAGARRSSTTALCLITAMCEARR